MTPNPLQTLQHELLSHVNPDPERGPLGGVGLFHCRTPQRLREVPIAAPTFVLVVSGHKELKLGARRLTVRAGELLLLPGGVSTWIGNLPAAGGQPYLALAVSLSANVLAAFRREHSEVAARQIEPCWSAAAPAPLVGAMAQWVAWCRHYGSDPAMQASRQREFLWLLARDGLAGNLLLERGPWRARVLGLISPDLAHTWEMGEVCVRLGTSEASLRRRLQEEGSGFRRLLEEARLGAALALMQDTFWPIARIAAEVGYASPSRFAERFKARFGLTPSELRATRVSASGEAVSGSGEPPGVQLRKVAAS